MKVDASAESSSQAQSNDVQIQYLKQSNKLLMATGSELKVFESNSSNQASNDWSSFSNFPRLP
jgi:hypothetical protein